MIARVPLAFPTLICYDMFFLTDSVIAMKKKQKDHQVSTGDFPTLHFDTILSGKYFTGCLDMELTKSRDNCELSCHKESCQFSPDCHFTFLNMYITHYLLLSVIFIT